MHCTRSSSWCSGMQGICAQLTGGLDLAVAVVVCKASLLDWLRVHLPSIYMHCTISSSRCSGMQDICGQLAGGSRSSSGCSGMQGICAQLTGGSICLLYICIVLDLAVGVVVCKASMLNWLGDSSAFYIYALYYI